MNTFRVFVLRWQRSLFLSSESHPYLAFATEYFDNTTYKDLIPRVRFLAVFLVSSCDADAIDPFTALRMVGFWLQQVHGHHRHVMDR